MEYSRHDSFCSQVLKNTLLEVTGELEVLIRNNSLRETMVSKDGGEEDLDNLRGNGRSVHGLEVNLLWRDIVDPEGIEPSGTSPVTECSSNLVFAPNT